jgi:ABC-type uncharacterized transport system ATPase subunit
MSISDRILVMYEGAVTNEVDPLTTTREAIGLMMAGVSSLPKPEAPIPG